MCFERTIREIILCRHEYPFFSHLQDYYRDYEGGDGVG